MQKICEFTASMPSFNQVWVDVHDVAVGVHEELFAVAVRDLRVIPIQWLEHLAPQLRLVSAGVLSTPVVHKAQRIDIGPGPCLKHLTVKTMHVEL